MAVGFSIHRKFFGAVGLALVLAVGCASSPPKARVPKVAAEPRPTPIRVGPNGSPPILFTKVLYRIPFGQKTGEIYNARSPSKKPIKVFQWRQSAADTKLYNVAATNRLREFGYRVIDLSDTLFESTSSVKTRFYLAGILTDLDMTERVNGRRPEKNKQNATVEIEFQLHDAVEEKTLLRMKFTGKGRDRGATPNALTAAFVDALDQLLSEQSFADAVVGAPNEFADAPVGEPLAIPYCSVDQQMSLPRDLGDVSESVVLLRVGQARGSGGRVSDEGHVLTAAHVVSGGDSVEVELPYGIELPARVVRIDKRSDVALLELPGDSYRCASIRRGGGPSVGSDVFVIGTPLSDILSQSVTKGIVSALREIEGEQVIQTDATVNIGNSGGPLLDEAGRVSGIVTLKAFGLGVEGIAFGVPIEAVSRRLRIVWQ